MVNEVSFYGQSVKNNSKKHMKTYGKNNNLIFHFALPSVLTSDYHFFFKWKKKNSGQKKKYWLLFRNCICTQISRNFSFPSCLCYSKAYCKITMPYVYRCIKTQMLNTNDEYVLYDFMLLIPELPLVHNPAYGLKERQAWL